MDSMTDELTDPASVRASLRRALAHVPAEGDNPVASKVDRYLASCCPHDPVDYHIAVDGRNGRPLVTCYACSVTWYADFAERLPPAWRVS